MINTCVYGLLRDLFGCIGLETDPQGKVREGLK